MAKGFKNNNPNDKLARTTILTTIEETSKTEVKPQEEPKGKEIEYKVNGDVKQKTKNGKYVGRPKTKKGNYKTINIAVEESILEKLDIIKLCYGNNLTQYINKLIEKDIEANYNNYKQIANSLNYFK